MHVLLNIFKAAYLKVYKAKASIRISFTLIWKLTCVIKHIQSSIFESICTRQELQFASVSHSWKFTFFSHDIWCFDIRPVYLLWSHKWGRLLLERSQQMSSSVFTSTEYLDGRIRCYKISVTSLYICIMFRVIFGCALQLRILVSFAWICEAPFDGKLKTTTVFFNQSAPPGLPDGILNTPNGHLEYIFYSMRYIV
jgi:hypothetical protein